MHSQPRNNYFNKRSLILSSQQHTLEMKQI